VRRLLVPALLLLTGCAGVATTGVPEPDRPGRAVLAHDVATGRLLWRKEVAPPIAATEPVLVGGVVLVPGGPLIAYDARSGDRLWSLDRGPGQPQVAGGLVVLQHGQDVQAVEPRSGRSLWRRPLSPDERVFAGPGGVVVLGDRTARLLTLAGDQAWRVDVPGQPVQAHPGADVVAVAGLRGGVLALATTDGRLRWRTSTSPANVVLVAGTRVLARVETGVLALDAADGRELWRQRAGGSGAPLQVAGGRVLAVQHGGTSRVLALADGAVLDEPRARDVELVADGLVRAEVDELRYDDEERGWVTTVANGDRPALWTDADDDVVVAVAGWGQPPTRD
jgi:outer membrane protein assembly factor BamB